MVTEIRQQLNELEISERTLRYFGLILGLMLGLYWLGHKDTLFITAVGAIVFVSIFFPSLLVWPYKFITGASLVIGWMVSRIALVFIYFTVVTVTKLIMKIVKKDLMKIKMEKNIKTYFEDSTQDMNYNKLF